jgi:hypothetical protein
MADELDLVVVVQDEHARPEVDLDPCRDLRVTRLRRPGVLERPESPSLRVCLGAVQTGAITEATLGAECAADVADGFAAAAFAVPAIPPAAAIAVSAAAATPSPVSFP